MGGHRQSREVAGQHGVQGAISGMVLILEMIGISIQ